MTTVDKFSKSGIDWLIFISLDSDKEHNHMNTQHETKTMKNNESHSGRGIEQKKGYFYLQVEYSTEFNWSTNTIYT